MTKVCVSCGRERNIHLVRYDGNFQPWCIDCAEKTRTVDYIDTFVDKYFTFMEAKLTPYQFHREGYLCLDELEIKGDAPYKIDVTDIESIIDKAKKVYPDSKVVLQYKRGTSMNFPLIKLYVRPTKGFEADMINYFIHSIEEANNDVKTFEGRLLEERYKGVVYGMNVFFMAYILRLEDDYRKI